MTTAPAPGDIVIPEAVNVPAPVSAKVPSLASPMVRTPVFKVPVPARESVLAFPTVVFCDTAAVPVLIAALTVELMNALSLAVGTPAGLHVPTAQSEPTVKVLSVALAGASGKNVAPSAMVNRRNCVFIYVVCLDWLIT